MRVKIFSRKSMKLSLNLCLTIFALFIFGEKSLSLTDYQIKNICKNEKRKSTCINFLKEKRSNLQKGNLIEIPVLPYKR